MYSSKTMEQSGIASIEIHRYNRQSGVLDYLDDIVCPRLVFDYFLVLPCGDLSCWEKAERMSGIKMSESFPYSSYALGSSRGEIIYRNEP